MVVIGIFGPSCDVLSHYMCEYHRFTSVSFSHRIKDTADEIRTWLAQDYKIVVTGISTREELSCLRIIFGAVSIRITYDENDVMTIEEDYLIEFSRNKEEMFRRVDVILSDLM